MKKKILENIKTLIYALIIALIIRSFLFQPFYIPSSSMEPTLMVGDRLFVSKYSYGYSRHSFPFSPKIFDGRIFHNRPNRGDVVVFKTPEDNRTDFIKRLIGLPGDKIQIINGDLFVNEYKIIKEKSKLVVNINCGNQKFETNLYKETISDGKKYLSAYRKNGSMLNTDLYIVPENHYFFLGDNRDCSRDSRFLSSVGYVHFDNLVGKAQIIFFSNDRIKGSLFKFWKWDETIRIDRFFQLIK